MSRRDPGRISPFAIRAADTLAAEVNKLVMAGRLDARSRVADALPQYVSIRFGGTDPINDLMRHGAPNNSEPLPRS